MLQAGPIPQHLLGDLTQHLSPLSCTIKWLSLLSHSHQHKSILCHFLPSNMKNILPATTLISWLSPWSRAFQRNCRYSLPPPAILSKQAFAHTSHQNHSCQKATWTLALPSPMISSQCPSSLALWQYLIQWVIL